MLTKYKFLNAEWLLRGEGEMENNETSDSYNEIKNKTPIQQSIFSEDVIADPKKQEKNNNEILTDSLDNIARKNKTISKIIFFYDDKTFSLFSPENIE